MHYGARGGSASGGVQRAGGRPLPRGTGARSPSNARQGESVLQRPRTPAPIGRRRAGCAPYGEGRASGNVRRACPVAWGGAQPLERPAGHGGAEPSKARQGTGRGAPEHPPRLGEGAQDARPTGKAVPAAMSDAPALWRGVARSPRKPWQGESEARRMRALRERPCQRQCQTRLPCGVGWRGAPRTPGRARGAQPPNARPRLGEGAQDARPTEKAVPAAMSDAHALWRGVARSPSNARQGTGRGAPERPPRLGESA